MLGCAIEGLRLSRCQSGTWLVFVDGNFGCLIGELGSSLRTSHANIAKIPTDGHILTSRRYIYEEDRQLWGKRGKDETHNSKYSLVVNRETSGKTNRLKRYALRFTCTKARGAFYFCSSAFPHKYITWISFHGGFLARYQSSTTAGANAAYTVNRVQNLQNSILTDERQGRRTCFLDFLKSHVKHK